MTDDIVTRLRECAKYCATDGNSWAERDCLEAADEISGLREQLAYYIRLHNELYDRLDLWGLVAKFEAEHDSDD